MKKISSLLMLLTLWLCSWSQMIQYPNGIVLWSKLHTDTRGHDFLVQLEAGKTYTIESYMEPKTRASIEIYDSAQKVVAEKSSSKSQFQLVFKPSKTGAYTIRHRALELPSQGSVTGIVQITVDRGGWEPTLPELYDLATLIEQTAQTIDDVAQKTGIRYEQVSVFVAVVPPRSEWHLTIPLQAGYYGVIAMNINGYDTDIEVKQSGRVLGADRDSESIAACSFEAKRGFITIETCLNGHPKHTFVLLFLVQHETKPIVGVL
ncbi:MAG: hypothetical protein KatS3mg087_0429 [Patescibacteria group bacterium]|nr:MAG: hypothetical protein KatS3mg087_0429 [Patescibacteria group bacterium]